MGIRPQELLKLVIEPSLKIIGAYSEDSAKLLLGIACVESNCGERLAQINGPARGIYQIEPETEADILRYLERKYQLRTKVDSLSSRSPLDLTANLPYQTVIARIKFLMIPGQIPGWRDLWALAAYWKKYYNTHLGKGRVEDFVYRFPKI